MLKPERQLGELQLEALIPHFYALVREDALIGPIFNGAIPEWGVHLDKLVAFWSSVMLGSGRYKSNPVSAHMEYLAQITPTMFDRWLGLWGMATEEIFPAPLAATLQAKLHASPRASSWRSFSAYSRRQQVPSQFLLRSRPERTDTW